MRSIQALRLMCTITSGEAASEMKRSSEYRTFLVTYAEHLRALYEEGDLVEPLISIHFWSTIIADSMSAMVSGSQPAFTDQDIESYASFLTNDTQEMIDLINIATLEDGPDVGWGLIFGNTCAIARQYQQRITSAKARKRPFLDVDFLADVPAEIERLHKILLLYEERLNALFSVSGWPGHFEAWARTARFLCRPWTERVSCHLADYELILQSGTSYSFASKILRRRSPANSERDNHQCSG